MAAGNALTGKRALYIIEDRRYDHRDVQIGSSIHHQLTNNTDLRGGLRYQHYVKHNFKLVEDLLGADFHIDVNKFEDEASNRDYDLRRPNRVTYENDTIGYNYDANIRKWASWLQWSAALSRIDLFASAKLTGTTYWREGFFQNAVFPDASYGESAKQDFVNYAIKGGMTYKISGRQYFQVNALQQTRPPYFRNAMISPRTRNTFADLTEESATSAEVAYYYRSPLFKLRLGAYWTQFEDQQTLRTAFFDSDNTSRLADGEFGNILLSNIDHTHTGIEAAAEIKLGYGLELGLAASLGQYLFTSRQHWSLVPDNATEALPLDTLVYSENFYIPGTPQRAFSAQLKYNSPKYWFISLQASLLTDRYLDYYPYRRTEDFVSGLTQGEDDELITQTLEQERVDDAFTLDLFGGKSFKFGQHYLYLTVGINNILDNQDIITGGFEQYRVNAVNGKPDFGRFPNKYYYAYGLNYFINLSYRL